MTTKSDIELLAHLLEEDENFYIDFKEQIDISTKEGKGEFLVTRLF